MFIELRKKLQQGLDRKELELSVIGFDKLIIFIINSGKKRYYSVLKNSLSAMYLTDTVQSCYCVLELLSI